MSTTVVSGNTESFPEGCNARMLFKESLLWSMHAKCPGAAGAWEARALLASLAGHSFLAIEQATGYSLLSGCCCGCNGEGCCWCVKIGAHNGSHGGLEVVVIYDGRVFSFVTS